MSSLKNRKEAKLNFSSNPVNKSDKKTTINISSLKIEVNSNLKNITLYPNNKGMWNPFKTTEKCMICWKPIDIHGKDAKNYMECRNCHQKAHQNHMLRWLAKKNYCPYCRVKW